PRNSQRARDRHLLCERVRRQQSEEKAPDSRRQHGKVECSQTICVAYACSVPRADRAAASPERRQKNRTRLLMVGNGNIFLAIFPIRLVLEDRQVQAQKACKSFCPGCSLGNSSGFLECFFYRVQSGSVQLRGVFRCIVFCASFVGRKRTTKP